MKHNYVEYVPILKALSDETRLKIVDMLSCGEMCACDILEYFNITQPTLSYHMKSLTECEIVIGRKDGAWMKYSLNLPKFESLKRFIADISDNTEDCICKEAGNCCCREHSK